MHQCLVGAAQALKAAGARYLYSSHAKLCHTTGDIDDLARQMTAAGYGSGQVHLGSFHIMGTARMAGDPTLGATDPTGQTYDVRDIVVCDASTFPTEPRLGGSTTGAAEREDKAGASTPPPSASGSGASARSRSEGGV